MPVKLTKAKSAVRTSMTSSKLTTPANPTHTMTIPGRLRALKKETLIAMGYRKALFARSCKVSINLFSASRESLSSGYLTRFDTNRTVQTQKMARGLKFLILEVKGLYYLCSENNGTVQLRGLRAANLQLCFCICKTVFFMTRLFLNLTNLSYSH